MTKSILSRCGETCLDKIEDALDTIINFGLGVALVYLFSTVL